MDRESDLIKALERDIMDVDDGEGGADVGGQAGDSTRKPDPNLIFLPETKMAFIPTRTDRISYLFNLSPSTLLTTPCQSMQAVLLRKV